jgi:sortase A
MKKKVPVILAVLLLIIGVGIMAYPAVSQFVNRQNGSYAITDFEDQMENLGQEEIQEQLRLAKAYNLAIASGEQPEGYEDILNLAGGMMGYIEIPEIDIYLPIYHGVSEEVLAKGIGHMPNSAFPIGGEGNHAVLTGHTGLPSAKLFTDLTELEEGDLFYIHILDLVLCYTVDQIKVVLPSEGQDLSIVPGMDYCTLVTCTPYGINSHRLLVRGIRTDA